MLNEKSRILFVSITSLLIFLSVVYLSSCSKQGTNKYSCDGVICLNGGYCDSSICICPVGYEGANCSIASVAKYIGTWDAVQTITWSDSSRYINETSSYEVFLKNSATPTTFFIFNFNNNPNYNNILCTIDTLPKAKTTYPFEIPSDTFTNNFTIDTFSNAYMLTDHYFLQWGAGSISASGIITANYLVKYLNGTHNWELDSVSLVLTPHL